MSLQIPNIDISAGPYLRLIFEKISWQRQAER